MAAHDTTEPGAHGDHADAHLPDPSPWPLVVGLAFGLVGAALIWWQRDTSNDLALVSLGAAGAFALLGACGWAYEDGRMRAKAEAGGGHGERAPRYNQLVTFAIPEGALRASGVEGGVLSEVEAAASGLRDLDGFQDMRITVSPADTGPSQVIVETTWSGREQLAGYNESRQSILDILARHDDQVVAGSVQAFDMEVLRDTKDVSFRFGTGAAATVLGSLVALGFMVGAGLTLFEEEGAATGNGETPTAPPDPYAIVATDNKFARSTLQAPPNVEVTFTLENNGRTIHNLSFYRSQGGQGVIVEGPQARGGANAETTFTAPGEGNYFFQCDFHPTEMTGTLEVTASAPAPGGAAPPAAGTTPGAGGTPAASPTTTR